MNNKLAYGEWALPVKGIAGMRLASEIGFEGVHLMDYDGEEGYFPLANPKVADMYMDAAEKYNLEISGYHMFSFLRRGYMVEPENSEKGQLARVNLDRAVEICKNMKIPHLMLGAEAWSEPDNAWKYKNFLAHLNYLCDLVEGTDITVSVESYMNVNKTIRMMDDTGNRAKVCYDLMNPLWFGTGEPLEDIAALKTNRLALIHVKDSPEDYQGMCAVTTGVNHIEESVRLLLDMGYDGWFVSENYYNRHKGADPYEAAARDVEIMKKLLNE